MEKAAATNATVILRGESGTGKELVAHAVHFNSKRRDQRLVVVNSAAIPDQLLESKQARALVLAALERVPLKRRAVLIMHDIDRLPMSEIATALSVYRFTGYSRLRKARQEFAAAVVSLRGAGEP